MHAAETHSSFIMKEIIEALISHESKYDNVLNTFVFKLVPMINVDGVVMGNA